MSEQNKALARQVFEDIQSQGNLALIDEIVASDYIGHTFPNDIRGPEGARQHDTMLRAGFPDIQVTVEDQIAEGDRVATYWTARGTHNGEFNGIAATGAQITIPGITIFRIANGKLVEGWNIPDRLGLMIQLGVIPAPQ